MRLPTAQPSSLLPMTLILASIWSSRAVLFQDCGIETIGCAECFQCCHVYPNCANPTSVVCGSENKPSCAGKTFAVSQTEQKSSVKSVRMVNAGTVLLHLDAQRSRVTDIHLENIRKLVIRGKPASRRQITATTAISANNISHLTIHPEAFSSWFSKCSSVHLSNVNTCNVAGKAFPSGAEIGRVVMMNIKLLEMEERAFGSKISSLSLRHVIVNSCKHTTFIGQINDMAILSSRIGLALHRCVGATSWTRLAIRSSSISRIEAYGLFGSIGEVIIENSQVGFLDRNSLTLEVSKLTFTSSTIRTFSAHAVAVHAQDSVAFRKTNITTLQKNAFQMLDGAKSLILSDLKIDTAETQSMYFNETIGDVLLQQIVLSEQCQCPTQDRAAELACDSQRSKKCTPNDARLTQLFENVYCQNNESSVSSLDEFSCRWCNSTCSMISWVPYVVTITSLLVIGVIIILIFKRQSILTLLRHSKHIGSLRNSYATVGDTAEKGVPSAAAAGNMRNLYKELSSEGKMRQGNLVYNSQCEGYATVTSATAQISEYEQLENIELGQGSSPKPVKPTMLYEDPAYASGDLFMDDPFYSGGGQYSNYIAKTESDHPTTSAGSTQDDREIQLPVYAQVIKKSPMDKTPANEQSPIAALYAQVCKRKRNDTLETTEASTSVAVAPVYAQVLKRKWVKQVNSGNKQKMPLYAKVCKKLKSQSNLQATSLERNECETAEDRR